MIAGTVAGGSDRSPIAQGNGSCGGHEAAEAPPAPPALRTRRCAGPIRSSRSAVARVAMQEGVWRSLPVAHLDGTELELRLLGRSPRRLGPPARRLNAPLQWLLPRPRPSCSGPAARRSRAVGRAGSRRRLARAEQTRRVRIARDQPRRSASSAGDHGARGRIAGLVAATAPRCSPSPAFGPLDGGQAGRRDRRRPALRHRGQARPRRRRRADPRQLRQRRATPPRSGGKARDRRSASACGSCGLRSCRLPWTSRRPCSPTRSSAAPRTSSRRCAEALFWTTTQLLTVSSSLPNPEQTATKFLDVVLELYAIVVVTSLAATFTDALHHRTRRRVHERKLEVRSSGAETE